MNKYSMDERVSVALAYGALADSAIYGLEEIRKTSEITEHDKKLIRKGYELLTDIEKGIEIEPNKVTIKNLYNYRSVRILENSNKSINELVDASKLTDVRKVLLSILEDQKITNEEILFAQEYLNYLSENYFRASSMVYFKAKERNAQRKRHLKEIIK